MAYEVFLTPGALRPDDVRGKTVVVIDVLRASTTIVTALENLARAVIPVTAPGEAGRLASTMDPDAVRLGGERDAQPIPEYHFGNSPLEFTPESIGGRTLVLSTTNGSALFAAAAGGETVVAGCFRNAGAIVHLLRAGTADVLFLCAGSRGRACLEDTLCAGLLLDRLWDGACPDTADDAARLAFTAYQAERGDIARALAGSTHGRRLTALGYGADVAFCAEVDASPVVPRFDGTRLKG